MKSNPSKSWDESPSAGWQKWAILIKGWEALFDGAATVEVNHTFPLEN